MMKKLNFASVSASVFHCINDSEEVFDVADDIRAEFSNDKGGLAVANKSVADFHYIVLVINVLNSSTVICLALSLLTSPSILAPTCTG